MARVTILLLCNKTQSQPTKTNTIHCSELQTLLVIIIQTFQRTKPAKAELHPSSVGKEDLIKAWRRGKQSALSLSHSTERKGRWESISSWGGGCHTPAVFPNGSYPKEK